MTWVAATSPGWQQECVKLAAAHEDFAVSGLHPTDLKFFRPFCRRYSYTKWVVENGFLFLYSP